MTRHMPPANWRKVYCDSYYVVSMPLLRKQIQTMKGIHGVQRGKEAVTASKTYPTARSGVTRRKELF